MNKNQKYCLNRITGSEMLLTRERQLVDSMKQFIPYSSYYLPNLNLITRNNN